MLGSMLLNGSSTAENQRIQSIKTIEALLINPPLREGETFYNYSFLDKDKVQRNIPYLAIRSNGIFIFEVINTFGLIYGKKNDPLWYHSAPGQMNKTPFANPTAMLNETAGSLSQLLEGKFPVIPLLVISQSNHIAEDENPSLTSLQTFQRDILNHKEKVLPPEQIQEVKEILEKSALKTQN